MPLDTALEYRVSIDVNKSQVKGKSDARIKKRDSSQVKEPHPDPATNPELFGFDLPASYSAETLRLKADIILESYLDSLTRERYTWLDVTQSLARSAPGI